MGNQIYDLIVIGAGSGGLGSALGMLELGFKVLLIDKQPDKIGGECLNTGCVPSKALLHVAQQISQARSAGRFGLETKGKINFDEVKNYIREKQAAIRVHENVDYLRAKGMDVIFGTASFHSEKEIKVNDKIYRAKNIVVSTGSSPRKIPIKGAASSTIPIFTNENIFESDFIPPQFIFIGAGPVSIELAQAFSYLGSKVSLIHRGTGILKKEDQDIAHVLLKKLQQEGINFYFQTEVTELENGNIVVLKHQSGKKTKIPADAIFMGLGRELKFEFLNLYKAGIATKNGRILLNERLQTTNKNVFVSGDAADNRKFSHAAEMHNMLLINNFISPLKKTLNFDHFPWVTFTAPEIATFGLNEKKLKEKNIAYEKLETDFSKEDRAVTHGFEYGKMILFIEKKRLYVGNAKILGGSMVAPNAGELIQELILANVAGLKLKVFLSKIYAYPTAGSIHKTLARNRIIEQIKPWMKKIFVSWYRLKE
jgi:pyruvate/2-oxoglutarate dehydrogenase complex dihydrolipoamide dehydrogenase (E3) component